MRILLLLNRAALTNPSGQGNSMTIAGAMIACADCGKFYQDDLSVCGCSSDGAYPFVDDGAVDYHTYHCAPCSMLKNALTC